MSDLIMEARNATPDDMLAILQGQQARKIDVVAGAERLLFVDGDLRISGFEPQVEDDGVTDVDGLYRPTRLADEDLALVWKIGTPYLRHLREQGRLDIYDVNLNGWLRGRRAKVRQHAFGGGDPEILRPAIPGDPSKRLLRLFRGDESGLGVLRTVRSSTFNPNMDHLDGLLALLAGIQAAGIDVSKLEISGDLTEKRMFIKVVAPEITAAAPALLKGYQNPFREGGAERVDRLVRGRDIDDWRRIARAEGQHYTEEEGGEPVLEAGLILSNSEVGRGKYELRPRLRVQICKNGLVITEEGIGKRHVGGELAEGVQWSADTEKTNIELITKQTADLVRNFLDPAQHAARVEALQEGADATVKQDQAEALVKTKKLNFTAPQQAGILEHFMLGGQLSAAGVLNAVTSYSQTLPDADEAFEVERHALHAYALAAR